MTPQVGSRKSEVGSRSGPILYFRLPSSAFRLGGMSRIVDPYNEA